jgi:hypothetical protein
MNLTKTEAAKIVEEIRLHALAQFMLTPPSVGSERYRANWQKAQLEIADHLEQWINKNMEIEENK